MLLKFMHESLECSNIDIAVCSCYTLINPRRTKSRSFWDLWPPLDNLSPSPEDLESKYKSESWESESEPSASPKSASQSWK